MNRVEHQKLNQTTVELLFGWSFGVEFDLRQTHALISTTNYFTIVQLLDNGFAISSNQRLCLPKAGLNTKNSTKRQSSVVVRLSFWLFSANIPNLYIWSSWTSTGNRTWSLRSNTNRLLISTDWCHNINKIVLKSLLLSLEGMYLTSYV